MVSKCLGEQDEAGKRPEQRTVYERQIAELSERQFGVEPEKLPERLKGATREEWEQLRAELKTFEEQKPKPLPQVKFVVSDAGPLAPANSPPHRLQRCRSTGSLSRSHWELSFQRQ